MLVTKVLDIAERQVVGFVTDSEVRKQELLQYLNLVAVKVHQRCSAINPFIPVHTQNSITDSEGNFQIPGSSAQILRCSYKFGNVARPITRIGISEALNISSDLSASSAYPDHWFINGSIGTVFPRIKEGSEITIVYKSPLPVLTLSSDMDVSFIPDIYHSVFILGLISYLVREEDQKTQEADYKVAVRNYEVKLNELYSYLYHYGDSELLSTYSAV